MKRLIAAYVIAAGLYAQTGAQVRGRVSGERGEPVRGEIAVIARGGAIHMSAAPTAENGYFTIDVPPGSVTLMARADGYVSEQRDVFVVPGRDSPEVRFSLAPAGSVSGRVVDPNGSGVAGARVWLVYRGEARSWRLGEETGGDESDAFGYFTIPVVAQGRPFVLIADSDNWLLSSSNTTILRGRELTGVTLLLSRRGSVVSGRVIDSSGRPVAGARVQLRATPSDAEFTTDHRASMGFARSMHKTAVTDDQGTYTFSGVPGGRAAITAQSGAGRGAAQAPVTPGQPVLLDLTLSR